MSGFQTNGPPEPIVSDYIELGSLILLFIIGAPLNLAAYTQIAERPAATRLDILKRYLNYSDLLVLFFYVPSRVCWLITYDWRGGDFLCKFVKCLHTFVFQVSSNVIVCIAIDRLLTVISASHHNPECANSRMNKLLAGAWITALIISAPQFAIWKDYIAFEEKNWSQCMQIWEIARAETYYKNNTITNANKLLLEENIYVILHMLLIFWIPATIIMMCYVIVSFWVYFNSKPSAFLMNASAVECAENTMRNGVGASVTYQSVAQIAITRPVVMNPKIIINDDPTRPLTSSNRNENDGSRAGSTSSTTTVNNVIQGTEQAIRQNSMLSAMRHSQSSSYSAKIKRNRALRISFYLVAAYICCWLPYNALSLIQFFEPAIFQEHANKVYCLHGIIVFNSVINPFIYGLFDGLCRQRRDS